MIVSMYGPAAKVAGLALLSVGVGFHSMTLLVPLALESAAERAATVIVLGFGRVAGAVYRPDALIVPVVALPPATPFTDQLTAVCVVPVTVAEKNCVAPARTFAALGATLTVIGGGGVVFDFVTPAQLTKTRISTIASPMSARRICFFMVVRVDPSVRMPVRAKSLYR